MLHEHLQKRNKDLKKREGPLVPELPNSSTEIFREAVTHIPALEYGWQTTFTTVGVAHYMAEVEPQVAQALVTSLKDQIIKTFPAERTKARCLLNILQLELDRGWKGSEKTINELLQTVGDRGFPPEKEEEWLMDILLSVARRSANSARTLVRDRYPKDWQDSDVQLQIAEEETRYDPQNAGQTVTEYLTRRWDFWPDALQWDPERKETRLVPVPRHPDSKEYAAQRFGWLVARYGDTKLAENMAQTLKEGTAEKTALLGEIGSKEPETEKGHEYIEQTRQLLERDDVWVGHYKRLGEAFSETNPELAAQFIHKFGQADYLGVGIPTSQVREVLNTGNFIEASRIVRTVIEKDLKNPIMIYPPIGPKHELEKLLIEVAHTNPQRVVALVDDNFSPTEKTSDVHLIGMKVDILVEGAKSLIEANHTQQAKELLARAAVLARSMKITRKPYERQLKGQGLAKQEEIADTALMKIKAWTLAKVGTAVARLEQVSSGL